MENGVQRLLARVRTAQPRFLISKFSVENIDGVDTLLLSIALKAKPEEGAANKELVTELDALFPSYAFILQSGHQQRVKILDIKKRLEVSQGGIVG